MAVPVLLLAAFLGATSTPSQPPPALPAVTPVQAELLADLQARQLRPGEIVFAKVFSSWQGPGCSLAQGAIVQAKVISAVAHSAASRESQVALLFDGAQCEKGKMGPFSFVLAAIARPEEDSDAIMMDMPRSIGGGLSSSAPNGMRSLSTDDSDQWWNMAKGFGRFPNVHAGGVYGLHGIALSVATGPENSTVLVSKSSDVAVFKHTELLLIPASIVARPVADAPPTADVSTVRTGIEKDSSVSLTFTHAAAPPEPLLEDETCTPPTCSIALDHGEAEPGSHPATSISIAGLGYTQRMGRLVDTLLQDETLSYLAPNELLVTFNLHGLVPRLGETEGGTVRIIRAALIDTETRKVRRIVDWHLPDDRQYLWPLAGGRVLVHVGNELRIYGAGLSVEASITLRGPLAFLRTDPAGETIVAGIVEERHSPELHAKLRDSMEREPDENVRVLVLNRRFETTATSESSTEFLPPVLLNEGEVKLYRQTDKHYHLVMETWDGHRRTLARFSSTCTPAVSTSAPDVLFLTTCSLAQGREYRLLRSDGKAILEGAPPPREVGFSAAGNQPENEVVVTSVETAQPRDAGVPLHAGDLASERLQVYSAANGKHLFSVQVNLPVASAASYAMAPDGHELAVLAQNEVAIYTVPRD
ncbi:MAG TPA: hypothetical protein VHZ25_16560 [Acidobacteriaceae bacterium]|jgi:hypothetical protein|nr:hypothetical protein [Acidobacteriaceae bacterium]